MQSIKDIKLERRLQIDLLRSTDDLEEQRAIKERVDFLNDLLYTKNNKSLMNNDSDFHS